jgi:hypothetical protein
MQTTFTSAARREGLQNHCLRHSIAAVRTRNRITHIDIMGHEQTNIKKKFMEMCLVYALKSMVSDNALSVQYRAI